MKLKRLKRFMVVGLASSLLFTSVPIQAAYLPSEYSIVYTNKAFDILRELESENREAGSGQYGLLNKLEVIQKFSLTLYYLEHYHGSLGLSGVENQDGEINYYASELSDFISIFNKSFNKKSSQFLKVKISLKRDELKTKTSLKTSVKKFNTEDVPAYLEELLKDIKDKTKDETESKVISEYGVLLSSIYQYMENVEDFSDELTNISPFKSETEVDSPIDFDTIIDIANSFKKIRNEYSQQMDIGAKVSSVIGQDLTIVYDPSKGYLSNMANVTEDDGNVIVPEDVNLSLLYLATLSASSTYIPLQSYVGDSAFLAALRSLVNDDSAVSGVIEFYDDVKNLRKPLYKRSLNKKGKPIGKAELITVQDFFSEIMNQQEGALVTVQGKFTYDSSKNFWIYADSYQTNYDKEELVNKTEEESFVDNGDDALDTTEATDEEKTNAATEKEESDSQGKTELDKVTNNNKGDSNASSSSTDSSKLNESISNNVTFKAEQDEKHKNKGTITASNSKHTIKFVIQYGIANTTVKIVDADGRIAKLKDGVKVSAMSTKKLQKKVDDTLNKYGVDKAFFVANNETLQKVIRTMTIMDATGAAFKNALGKLSSVLTIKPMEVNATGIDSAEASGSSSESEKNGTGESEKNEIGESEKNETGESENSETIESENTETGSINNSTSVTTSQVENMSVMPQELNGIMADLVITSEDRLSEPLLLYSGKHARGTDNLTTVIIQNILKGTIGYENLYQESNDYLYINCFGDIVTDDNRVILPGCANPLIYASDTLYNPFSVAFMNYYPRILQNDCYFQIAAETDLGKQLIFDNDLNNVELDDSKRDKRNELAVNKAVQIVDMHDIKAAAPLSIPKFETNFYTDEVSKTELLKYQRLMFGNFDNWNTDNSFYMYTPLIISTELSNNGVSIFPYILEDDIIAEVHADEIESITESGEISQSDSGNHANSYSTAEIIAYNMFHHLTTSEDGTVSNLKKLNDNYLLHYLCISNLNGTDNPNAYANADTFSYDRYVENSSSRKAAAVKQFSDTMLNSLGKTDAILGVKNAYQDKILGNLFAYLKENAVIFFIILFIIFLYAFARVQRDMFQTIILLLVCTTFSYAFVYVIPNYIPFFYNSVVNNLSSSLSYEIVGVKTEYNSTVENTTDSVDENGKYLNVSSSLNLYRNSAWDLNDFYNGLGISEKDVVGDKVHLLKQEAGTYVEGDSIKESIDVLFDTLKISGKIDDYNLAYTLCATKTISNNIDYYTPFYQIVDQFISKLNDLARVYQIPRKTSVYAEGVNKDDYLVYSYVNSLPFLSPGEYSLGFPEDLQGLSSEEREYLELNQAGIADALEETFGDKNQATDWLGISNILYGLSDKDKQTLWAQTLYDNGYYYCDLETEEDWVPNNEKLDDLITYVNYQTKNFVFQMDNQVGALSDDIMVKLISLRALIAFNQRASEFGHWLYPFTVNYQEFTLKDILSCVFVKDYRAFVKNNLSITEYILQKYGWPHLIVFDVIIILLFLTSSIIQYSIPFMYLLLGVLLLLKFIQSGDIKIPLKGYIKYTIIVMCCSTFNCIGILLARKTNTSVFSLYLLLIVLVINLYVLLSILSSLIFHLTDFGNASLNTKIEGLVAKANPSNYNMQINTTRLFKQKDDNYQRSDTLDEYALDRRMDDVYHDEYSNRRRKRNPSYDEEYYYDDYSNSHNVTGTDFQNDSIILFNQEPKIVDSTGSSEFITADKEE